MNNDRHSLLARIHILKKEKALPENEYRALLANFGVTSSAQLDDDGLMQLAAVLSDNSEPSGLSNRNCKKSSKKIWAAWYELRKYLPAYKQSAGYLCGIARRNAPGIALACGVLDFDTVTREQADGIIRSLISAVNREKSKMADVPF